ncbi:substrate-binding domain-containing protein [Streptomyces sp. MZ04]|uniref:substrate-binding domain-containing protein n=1 Tax=Streptomyces sp. MZ04 TaxID=2559236 RepID=UPI00107EE6BD|nr:substrate-binding domain-containing protein [Streptomyces sp. MZ04]TGB14735.1 sugar ABC transporter substrate-binding protein [Streptomyces sp. MZ04]
MRHSRKRPLTVSAAALLLAAATGCSSSGGKQEQERTSVAGRADTPRMKIAMITHAPAGDTFFDVIRKGATAAAAKDNVRLVYSNAVEVPKQAALIQNAIDSKVDGIAVTLPNPTALAGALKKAEAAGIPVVAFNAGDDAWQKTSAMMYFGEPEETAGEKAGRELNKAGAKHALCVLQAQGQVQLEARCAGLEKTFEGRTEKLYANGEDMAQFVSIVTAKLRTDRAIDAVVTLNSPHGIAVAKSVRAADGPAKVATFGLGKDLIPSLKDGSVLFTVDQQPYLQGYEAIDTLWLYRTNGNVLGADETVPTGPYIVTKKNVAQIADYARNGTR